MLEYYFSNSISLIRHVTIPIQGGGMASKRGIRLAKGVGTASKRRGTYNRSQNKRQKYRECGQALRHMIFTVALRIRDA